MTQTTRGTLFSTISPSAHSFLHWCVNTVFLHLNCSKINLMLLLAALKPLFHFHEYAWKHRICRWWFVRLVDKSRLRHRGKLRRTHRRANETTSTLKEPRCQTARHLHNHSDEAVRPTVRNVVWSRQYGAAVRHTAVKNVVRSR